MTFKIVFYYQSRVNSIPLQLPKQIKIIIAFRPKNNKELKNVAKEVTKYDHPEFLKIAEYVLMTNVIGLLF